VRTAPLAATPGQAARFGVEVRDVDLRDIDDLSRRADLAAALRTHKLLVFRDQTLSDTQHVAVAAVFGPIALEGRDQRSAVGFVSNHRADGVLGSIAASFHIDYGFFPTPYHALSLYGLEIPPSGTVTRYADAIGAAHDLPDHLRERVAPLQARAVVDVASEAGEAGVRVRLGRLDEGFPHQLRPVLWPHRDTGEPILAVWEQQTDAILPLPDDESTALVEELFAHLYAPAHLYEHHWREGDLVVWDNHAVQHARPDVGTEEPRTLRRVCIGESQDLSLFANYVRSRA
jgi:taurine dioxygenase